MNLRAILSFCFFYLRLLIPLGAKAAAALAGLFGPAAKRAVEQAALPLCNKLFKPIFDPAQFLSVESFSRGQDVSDFFTLCRKTGIDDAWFTGQRILDAGCGSGLFAIAAAQKNASEVVGIDIDEPRIPYARESAKKQGIINTNFHIMSLYDMSFGEATFDRIISHTVFEHLPDLPGALEAMYRVLKPGGEAFITHDSFRARYGAHVGHFITIPWPCFFFSQESVIAFWKSLEKSFLQERNITESKLDLLGGGLNSLNRLKISEVIRAVGSSPFETVALIPYGQEKALLAIAPWIQNMPTLYEYVRGSIAMRLRRPAV